MLFACRGYARAGLTVRTLAPPPDGGGGGGARERDGRAVPDPILCLAKALGALRRDGDGALAVPGLHAIRRDAYATPRLQVDTYDESRLRAEAGLLDGCALVHAHGAEGGDAGIAEQLQWYRGSRARSRPSPTARRPRRQARARLRAPAARGARDARARARAGERPADALAALEARLARAAPWARGRGRGAGGATGYLSDPRTPFLDEMMGTHGERARARPAALEPRALRRAARGARSSTRGRSRGRR